MNLPTRSPMGITVRPPAGAKRAGGLAKRRARRQARSATVASCSRSTAQAEGGGHPHRRGTDTRRHTHRRCATDAWRPRPVLAAISTNEQTTYSISGKETVVGKVDYSKCAICQNGARPNRYHKSAPADRMAGVCTRSCVAHLSEGNRLEDTPRLPFRRREPWTLLPHDIWSLDRRRNIE